MRIGILGTGNIARKLTLTMKQMPEAECYAVAARKAERAELFAGEHGFKRAYGSYTELISDDLVELVLIGTPHSHHYEQMKLCIEHGKPVLCEKSFTMNGWQAREILALAQERNVFAAEAIWTRYMPSRNIIDQLLGSGVIGEVRTLTANLSYKIDFKERIMQPELAGGALLDVGVYVLNFARMHFGTEIERVESSVVLTETGVDGQNSINLIYKDGRMASLISGIYGRSDRQGIFYGSQGYMIVENVNNPISVSVYDMQDHLLQKIMMPKQISGYEYEIQECIESIQKGSIECESMPHREIAAVMELMDGLRADWGIIYPQEKT